MKHYTVTLVILPLILLESAVLTNCATQPRNPDGTYPQSQPTMPMRDYDEDSKARGAAYVTDAMHVRRPMPSHSDWKPLEFYYKHCTKSGDDKAHYPKADTFECSGPY
ncbi:hypothetical protein OAQ84_01890 [Bdellovibrionales bacterium]|nr:hypothetical protein [Bdellovibrionales bacterium]